MNACAGNRDSVSVLASSIFVNVRAALFKICHLMSVNIQFPSAQKHILWLHSGLTLTKDACSHFLPNASAHHSLQNASALRSLCARRVVANVDRCSNILRYPIASGAQQCAMHGCQDDVPATDCQRMREVASCRICRHYKCSHIMTLLL